MKKKLLLFSAGLFMTLSSFAGKIVVEMNANNGGTSGYDEVKISSSNIIGGTKTTIDCKNPGSNPCQLTVSNPILVPGDPEDHDAQELIDDVRNDIQAGDLVGSVVIDAIDISWSAADNYNYSILIESDLED